jgi:hypothetical protein
MPTFNPQDLPSGSESRESHLAFIQLNWPIAAAAAWQQYRRQGRGCIVFDVAEAQEPPPGESHLFGETPGRYVPYKVVRASGDADVERMVKKYNPRREVVFVFLRRDGGVSSYQLSIQGQPSPPEAYEALKREL